LLSCWDTVANWLNLDKIVPASPWQLIPGAEQCIAAIIRQRLSTYYDHGHVHTKRGLCSGLLTKRSHELGLQSACVRELVEEADRVVLGAASCLLKGEVMMW